MSQRFELFIAEQTTAPTLAELVAGLERLGAAFQRVTESYWSGSWEESRTGARAVLDVGTPPLEEDRLHPPRQYAGWRPLAVAIELPLLGPHWRALEVFAWLERVLAAWPAARALDVEDVPTDERGQAAPGAWDRARVCASWRRQHRAQIAGMREVPRMPVAESLMLWRWRRERRMEWSRGTVALDLACGTAHPLWVWTDPAAPAVLPAGGLICVLTSPPILVQRSQLPEGTALPEAGAALVPPPAAWPRSLPRERFRICDDDDWTDEPPDHAPS